MKFSGQLHEVVLINFSVSPYDLKGLVPDHIQPRLFNGRAMISMVDVQLRNMKADAWWLPFHFAYQHVAFRLLIHDEKWTEDGQAHGIHFLQSFSDRALMVSGGNRFADYKLSLASMQPLPAGLYLESQGKSLHYNLDGPVLEPDAELRALQATIGQIDRAYSVRNDQVLVTRIMRTQWPLKAMHCNRFEMAFFPSAKFEGAFKVPVTIDYTWLPAEVVTQKIPQPVQLQPNPKAILAELSLQ